MITDAHMGECEPEIKPAVHQQQEIDGWGSITQLCSAVAMPWKNSRLPGLPSSDCSM
jgi:hypothetical protein